MIRRRSLLVTFLFLSWLPLSFAADAEPRFAPIGGSVLDPTSFAESVDGRETPITSDEVKAGVRSVVWTDSSRPDWKGVTFGAGRATGARHLRIGFQQELELGTLLVRGGGTLSVLKLDVSYPGDLTDDSQWLPADRLQKRDLSRNEVGREEYALWVLPAGTKTRAVRFSHLPNPGDREASGWLGGLWMLQSRIANVAPQALAQSVQRDDYSAKLIDETNNDLWKAWDNGEKGAALPVSAEHPEFITLSWPQPVKLEGVCLLWTGCADVVVEAFMGTDSESIREAGDAKWRAVGHREGMDPLYPMALGPHWIPFDQPTQSRAIRLRVNKGTKSTHGHLDDKVKEGRRVWLGELLAVTSLSDSADLKSVVLPEVGEEPPPIPVKFTLPSAGLVTLVIEDAAGNRVRNLVSETPFPAGENIAWWDGSDDLLRDPEAAKHGVYHIPTRLVSPGEYKVRGLWHEPLKLHYEFSIYNAGKPAWTTADNTGCWLTTHTPPTSIAFVPGSRTADGEPLIVMGAFVAEGGHGLQWLHEDGTKVGGQSWVGGNWTGAPTLAVDLGAAAVSDHLCYVGSVWEGELRLTAKTRKMSDQPVLKLQLGNERDRKVSSPDPSLAPVDLQGFEGGDKRFVLGSIASQDGVLVCSLVRQEELLVVDVRKGEITSRIPLKSPRGLCFDKQGRLLALSGQSLVRFQRLSSPPETIISDGLDDPRQIAIASNGDFLISVRGKSHQVLRYSANGQRLGHIGRPGEPAIGPYDPLHLNNPNGLCVDSQGRVWVAEADNYPRRVSLWSAKGELLRAFYGPTEYGGGGVLDPQDRTRFYYKGLEFKLDWEHGTDQLVRVFARPNPLLDAHYGHYSPDTPLYPEPGGRYFTSCYTHTPTNGDHVAFLWRDDQHARLCAGVGDAHSWSVLREERFAAHWPEGTKPAEENPQESARATFAWADLDGDERPQPNEVTFFKQRTQGVTIMNDLSVVIARFGDRNVRLTATIDAMGVPRYDVSQAETLGPAGGAPVSSGGNQSLTEPGGWTICTNAPKPLSPYGLGGTYGGEPKWSYPSPWSGLHASHEAAVPDRPGMVVGHTRLLGGWVGGKVGPMFCINGNMGNMYLFTADGLFVGTLFHDIRLRPNWAAPVAVRNMDVTNVSLHDENFWPSMTQTPDGKVYLVDGARTSLVRIDGLETLQRIPESTITVSTEDLAQSRDWFTKVESQRQQQQGSGLLNVGMKQGAPTVDGKLDDWPATTDWAFIDRRGTKANFNSNSRPYEVSAAVAVTNTTLFAAWRTTEKDLLNNSGETENALFKHGGCLDIMLATDPTASPDRRSPAPGDQRLLITRVHGKTRATLYRGRVPNTQVPVAYSSPWRTIDIDVVEDVSDQVTFAEDRQGNYEISLPLAVLNWRPRVGEIYQADLGILRGSNGQTTQRVYWTNKATAITADVPSEAELTPRLWGKWKIVSE